MSVFTILAAIAIVVLILRRQLAGGPLRAKRVVRLPLILTVIGVVLLAKGPRPGPVDVGFLLVGALIAAGLGAGLGAMMRLESRDGALWGRMPPRGLWLWAALILSRVVLSVAAHGMDARVASSATPILLMLGINRLAQAGVVTRRAQAAGVPFAAEPDHDRRGGGPNAVPIGAGVSRTGRRRARRAEARGGRVGRR
ncbi:hypothetical protein [Embleya sp. AB8]|uniref:hypothetical protein n=1 Tax=Embleya sp. AB8 TaxID=3156304 RepID=UPI003C75953E